MKTRYKKIALVDPVEGGHHNLYLNQLLTKLSELGYEVTVFSPNKNVIFYSGSYSHVEFKSQPQGFSTFSYLLKKPFRLWSELNKTLSINKIDKKDTLVFISWLDDFLLPLLPSIVHQTIFDFDYTGIYFKPYHLYSNKNKHRLLNYYGIFSSDRCKFLYMVENDNNLQMVSKKIKKNVSFFPDFISEDCNPNDISPVVIEHVKKFTKLSKGKTIISVIGSLQKRKNLINLINATDNANNDLYLVFYGKIKESEFSNQELDVIRTWKNKPDCCYIVDEFINTESEINFLYSHTDVVWAAYYNWKNTSNALTKAAFFKKTVIVPKESYLADATNRYSLGLVVDETDVTEITTALKVIQQFSPEMANYAGFYDKHSQLSLHSVLESNLLYGE